MQKAGIDVAAELPELLPDPVVGCDTDGTVVYWSRAAEDTYGYTAAEAVGRRAATLLHTRFPVPLLEITEELADLGRWQGILQHRRQDGQTVSVHSRWVARRDERGTHVGSFAVERELQQQPAGPEPAPSEPARDAVPRTLAHELNNALAIIVNYTAFVVGALESPGAAPSEEARRAMRADLHEVQAAAERALAAIRQI